MLSQWKVFDNLRRSLVPAALTLLAAARVDGVAGVALDRDRRREFCCCHRHRDRFPILRPNRRKRRSGTICCRGAARVAARRAGLLALAFLPYEAFFCLDAIVRTIGRMLITRRRLLNGIRRATSIARWKAIARTFSGPIVQWLSPRRSA
jgi:cyclic beta-1,2-glucan synthetase